jgi:hypothetical protein
VPQAGAEVSRCWGPLFEPGFDSSMAETLRRGEPLASERRPLTIGGGPSSSSTAAVATAGAGKGKGGLISSGAHSYGYTVDYKSRVSKLDSGYGSGSPKYHADLSPAAEAETGGAAAGVDAPCASVAVAPRTAFYPSAAAGDDVEPDELHGLLAYPGLVSAS